MGQGDDLELRQHRVPEEGMGGHDQRQPGVALLEEDAGKAQQRAQRTETHDQQTLAGMVAQPAPQIRRYAAHQHGNGDQLADARRGKAQVIEVQGQKGRRPSEQGEVEEVESGQPPVRKSSHRLQAAGFRKPR